MQTENRAATDDVIVVGGGIIGLCCALEIQQRGIATSLLALTEEQPSASWGNAGHIAVEQVEPLASMKSLRGLPHSLFWRGGAVSLPPSAIRAWLPFALRLLKAARPRRFRAGKEALSSLLSSAMPAWHQVAAAIDAPDLLVESGHIVAWETPATAAAGRSAWRAASTGTATYRDALPEELDAIATLTGRAPAGAIRFMGSGHIADLGELQTRLKAAFEALGGTSRDALVRSVRDGPEGRMIVDLDDGGELAAGAVVIAAGLGSKPLMESLGHIVPIIAERGYHIQSAAPTEWPDSLPPIVFSDRFMVVTPFRTGLRATSFVEFVAPETPPDTRKWKRLRQHAGDLGLPFGAPIKEWTGCRPTLPDYLPAIGCSRRAQKLFYAFGHQHLGLTLAAVTGQVIGEMVTGSKPSILLSAFDIERFAGGGAASSKNEVAPPSSDP